MIREKIVRNSARCRICTTEIESKHVHDYVRCPCGAIAVDGGKEYLRRIARDLADIEETSVLESAA